MSEFSELLNSELFAYEELLQTIPFTNYETKRFLKIYNLNFKELNKYFSCTAFPIDNNKLLKLTISLGNLIKSLQLDEEMYKQGQQTSFTSKLTAVAGSPKHYINSEPISSQPSYQVKFIRNFLLIFKNFDIGHEVKDSVSSSTLNQFNSPIKLNSNQLLIEKLEINIDLDTLFIYKTLLDVLTRILKILKSHTNFIQDDQGSIFSGSSDSISADEYVRILNQILNRINNGLIEPLLKHVLEFVNSNVSNEFKTLITSV